MRQNRMEQWLSCVIKEGGAMRQNRMGQWLPCVIKEGGANWM